MTMTLASVAQQAAVISQLPSLWGKDREASAVSAGSRGTLSTPAWAMLVQPRDLHRSASQKHQQRLLRGVPMTPTDAPLRCMCKTL